MKLEQELLDEVAAARKEVAEAEGEFFPVLEDQPQPDEVMEANPPKELEEAGERLQRARERLDRAEREYEHFIKSKGGI